MKRIRCLKDLKAIQSELSNEIVEYLKEEFYSLYEYLSNGEEVEDFLLPFYQSMILLEDEGELSNIMNKQLELEFVEKVNLANGTIFRIGVNVIEDIQLHYAIKITSSDSH
jgi:hypothetical protein